MYCKHCGKEVDKEALVCIHCGKLLRQIKQTTKNPEFETSQTGMGGAFCPFARNYRYNYRYCYLP